MTSTYFITERKPYSELEPGDTYLSRVYGAGIATSEVIEVIRPLPVGGVHLRCQRLLEVDGSVPEWRTFEVEAHGTATVVTAQAR